MDGTNPSSEDVQKVMRKEAMEARRLSHKQIEAEHLALALLDEGSDSGRGVPLG